MSEGDRRLRERLGDETVDQLGSLSAEEMERLANTLEATCASQSAAIATAAEGSLRHSPN